MEEQGALALGTPQVGRHNMIVGEIGSGPFKDCRDAREHWVLYRAKMLVYPVLGCPGTTIEVPEADPDYPRLTAEEAFAALIRVPDLRLVYSLVIVDDVHRVDPWRRQTDPDWRVFGETLADGEIRLYRPTANDPVSAIVNHEWSHLLERTEPKWRHAFEQVGELEQFIIGGATADTIEDAEQWAHFGERVLSAAPLLSPAIMYANPIRGIIWAEALAQRLTTLPAGLKGPQHGFYQVVVNHARETARPVALERLANARAHSGFNSAAQAQLILDMLQSV